MIDKTLNSSRRRVIGIGVAVVASMPLARAAKILGGGPVAEGPDLLGPPPNIDPQKWTFFSAEERVAVEAVVDTLIPADQLSPSGKDVGCAVFIDRQMSGAYGRAERRYMEGPFVPGLPTQGPQSPLTPADVMRKGLVALDSYCKLQFAGHTFAQLSEEQRESVLTALEHGTAHFEGDVSATAFFNEIYGRTMEGFFADPAYGGNKDMASWKMIGYPGSQYNYLDWVARHNEKYPNPPIGMRGGDDWEEGKGA